MIRRLFIFLLLTAAAQAGALPPGQEILAFARAQLPPWPVTMSGSLKERAPNGFVKKDLAVEMDLNWHADPSQATYRIRDLRSGETRTLVIRWLPAGPEFHYMKNGAPAPDFDPESQIDGLGVTWADLSFAFLWNPEAETLRTERRLGRDCFVIAIPAPGGNSLLLWIEQSTGRVLGVKEENAAGRLVKEIKVVSVREFDGLWMVKDLDIIRPLESGRTTLRIDQVEAVR